MSVGHGCAIVIETPQRRSLVYDVGMITDGFRAQQAVQTALWQRHNSQIDYLVVSHADTDHFNGVPGLLKSVVVGKLAVSEPFRRSTQSGVTEVLETDRGYDVPELVLKQGDEIPIDDQIRVTVLHPGERWSASDNPNSIVLMIEYADRRILLTGDLEHEGTYALIEQPIDKVDVMLAPHHGSPTANPRSITEWANPQFAIISTGRRNTSKRLSSLYPEHTKLLSTVESGAITFEIDNDGSMTCHSYVDGAVAVDSLPEQDRTSMNAQ